MINVTKSYLPPLEEYEKYLEQIWESNQLTNNGALVRELEEKLKEFLNVKHLFFVSNGTVALQLAIKALSLDGEVITTPFSYVATTSSLVWEGCQPIFADIDPNTLCIAPDLIKKVITSKTSAILPTHVYGYPCDVESIQEIARKHNLKVIYDAAHTFGGQYKGKSIASYGDISALSFHATKIFHTVEGGAVVTSDDEIAHKISYMRNFGHKGKEDFFGLGINGKNSEFHAAMGLTVLPKLPEIISNRKEICRIYDQFLSGLPIERPTFPHDFSNNYAYYPVIFDSEITLLQVVHELNEKEIYPRRYFYPSLNHLPYISPKNTPVSDDIAKRVLCLPLYSSLEEKNIQIIAQIIQENLLQ